MIFRRNPRRVRVAFRPARARYRTRAAASSLRPLLAVAVLGAGAMWGSVFARRAWAGAQWNRVKHVAVAPASLLDGAPPEGFDRAVGLKPGDALFGFSSGAASRRLREQFPELADVRVRRTWNGGVKIVFRRRRAAAKVWDNGQWLGMDVEGGLFPLRVFAPEESPPENVLPEERLRPLPILAGVPSGAAARPALAFAQILGRLPQSWARGFYKMKLAPSGEATLFLKEGPLVAWGPVDVEEARVSAKADRLERVLRHPRLAGAIPESVRFVDDRRLAVKPKVPKEI